MIKTKQLTAALLTVVFTFLLASCSSSDNGTNPTNNSTPIKVQFKTGTNAYYEILTVDTTEHFDTAGAQYNVEAIVTDTNHFYGGKSGVTMIIFASNPRDTEYYYQDASGDLYRYNYGFSILSNQYPTLITYLGAPINVGWVLVAKPGAVAGTTWTASQDSQVFQSLGSKIYLKDVATAMTDTSFIVSKDTVKAFHVRHDVTASTPPGAGQTVGEIIVDTYISAELGMTVEDYFHHSKISGLLLNAQQPGKLTKMTLK